MPGMLNAISSASSKNGDRSVVLVGEVNCDTDCPQETTFRVG